MAWISRGKSSVWLTFLKNKCWFWWPQVKYQYWGHDEFCLNQHSENKWNKNTNILLNGNINLLKLTYITISYHLYIFIWKYSLPFKSLRPVGFFLIGKIIWLTVIVKTFILLQKIYISNECCFFYFLFIKESWKCITVSIKILRSTTLKD